MPFLFYSVQFCSVLSCSSVYNCSYHFSDDFSILFYSVLFVPAFCSSVHNCSKLYSYNFNTYVCTVEQQLMMALLDSDLLLLLLQELSVSVHELLSDLKIARAVTTLSPEVQSSPTSTSTGKHRTTGNNRTTGNHITHCQRLNCQREIFEIYLSCSLCGYLCLNCASGGGDPSKGGCVEYHKQPEGCFRSENSNSSRNKNQLQCDVKCKFAGKKSGFEQEQDPGKAKCLIDDVSIHEKAERDFSRELPPSSSSKNFVEFAPIIKNEKSMESQKISCQEADQACELKSSNSQYRDCDFNINVKLSGEEKEYSSNIDHGEEKEHSSNIDHGEEKEHSSNIYHIHAKGSKILLKSPLNHIKNAVNDMADLIISFYPDLQDDVTQILSKYSF